MPRPGTARWARPLAPLVVLLAVLVMDLAGGRQNIVLALSVVGPMLAATLTSPRLTAIYAVAALTLGALLGIRNDLYTGDYGGGAPAQVFRLAGIAAGGIIAVVASYDRTRREARLKKVMRVAEVAQRAILSTVPPSVGDLRFAVSYESAAAEATVGGDLYDVVDSPWGIRIIVGDVRGKGLDAVRLASRVLGGFRVAARYTADFAAVISVLDAEVVEVGGSEDFVTAALAQISGDRLALVNAGHPDPLLLRGGTTRLISVVDRQPPLGLGADGATAATHRLKPHDRLLFYTDGLTEARHPTTGEFFPILGAVEAAFQPGSLDDSLAALGRALRRWTASTLTDDVAMVAVEVRSH